MSLQNSVLYNFGNKLSIFGLVIFAVLHSRKLKLCRWHLFSNAVKIMLFISDVKYYVSIKLCKTTGSIHLFKITSMPKPENVKLRWNYIWGVIEEDWKEVNVAFDENVTVVQSTAPGTPGEFNQPLMLGLVSWSGWEWEHMQGLIMTDRSHF